MSVRWEHKKFEALSPYELYAILQLRNAVFVVEQNCIFQDADDKDQLSYHLMGWQNEQLVAYTRLVPPGLAYQETSIGRVVTATAVRGNGLGKKLMEESIRIVYLLWGDGPVRIGAQLYLKAFYSSFGFRQSSDIYQEDGIDHIQMLLEIKKH